jgi:hypothetical protein
MSFCSSCGANVRQAARFCDNCGRPVAISSTSPSPKARPAISRQVAQKFFWGGLLGIVAILTIWRSGSSTAENATTANRTPIPSIGQSYVVRNARHDHVVAFTSENSCHEIAGADSSNAQRQLDALNAAGEIADVPNETSVAVIGANGSCERVRLLDGLSRGAIVYIIYDWAAWN